MVKSRILIIKIKFFVGLLFLFVTTLSLSLTKSYSASVTGATQSVAVNFGTFASGNSTGTITSNNGTVTGGIKYFSGAVNATFTVSGTNMTGGTSTYRRMFTVFIPSGNVTLTNGINTIDMVLSLSSSNTTVKSQNFSFPGGNGTQTFSIPVYGTLTVPANQMAGNYTGSYNFIACDCNVSGGNTGCATSSSDLRCQ